MRFIGRRSTFNRLPSDQAGRRHKKRQRDRPYPADTGERLLPLPPNRPRTARVLEAAAVGIGNAFGLKPHLAETFKLSTDPLFIDKVREIVGRRRAPRG
jgi:hypothetical protein